MIGGAAIAVAPVLFLPLLSGTAEAVGAVVCEFDTGTGVARVDVTGFEQSVVLERSMDERLLVNADLCVSTEDVVADFSNIRTIVVRGGPAEQALAIDLDGGSFTPGRGDESGGSDEIEFDIALGEGSDYVEVRAYDAGSSIRAGTKSGAHLLNLNPNEKTGVDADVTLRSVEQVAMVGAMGDDRFYGTGGRGTGNPFRLTLYLSDFVGGNDWLVGGAASDYIEDSTGNDTDLVRGGAGWDSLSAYDQDPAADLVEGKAGQDVCHYDVADVVNTCEATPQS
jgi:hypothetical protein